MKKVISLSFALLFGIIISKAQTPILIPDTLSGSVINLNLKDSLFQFYGGTDTKTLGYNGSYLGPTIILNQGQKVTLNVHNLMKDTTTTHWHGLHVAPINDGSPHNPILAGATWSPSFTVLDKAATYWYHPHLHRKTMKQVLKGAAGLIIVRDEEEKALALPRKYGEDDFPLVCQWKTFDNNTKQIVLDDELDNATMVNGNLNGYLNVPAQMVRLRLLNGSSHRFFYFALSDNGTFNQIGGDESLLDTPVAMTKLMLAPGERAEIIIDFSGQTGKIFYLKQLGTQLPSGYPGGPAGMMGGTLGPLDNKDFNLLQFNVTTPTKGAITSLPSKLTNNIITSSTGAGSMNFLLQGSPQMSMTNFIINGTQYKEDVINFTTKQDSVMIWNITNQSAMPHPWHIHGNHFFIQTINGIAPAANLKGRKDVVVVPPQGGNVKLIMKYSDFSDTDMPYMYHCHINSHEDNGMMGQFIVNSKYNNISNLDKSSNFSIYPNPINDKLNIQFENRISLAEIKILDVLGQVIMTRNLNYLDNTSLDLSVISMGVYFIQVNINSKLITQKFIKQ